MQSKKTLILGASINPSRYAYIAAKRLIAQGHPIVLIGNKVGTIDDQIIQVGLVELKEPIDTVTLYLSPSRQINYYDYLLQLHPNRVIFNPGTENPELMSLLEQNKIKFTIACTLVLLSTEQY